MKITGIETFVVDAGWRPWQFVAVRTDAGITGYGECSDGRNPYGVVATLGEEVVRRGFRALKTNIVYPGDPARVHFAGFGGGPGTTDQNVTPEMVEHIATLLGTFRKAVGPHVGLALDLNFNFKAEAARRICRALEPLGMMWVELDMYDERALREVKDAASMPICSGENLYGLRE